MQGSHLCLPLLSVCLKADSLLPAAERRNYANVFSALYRIAAEEGPLALWKGAGPTVVRAMALNMGMLASYDQSVEFFRDNMGWKEIPTVVGASAVSGFFAAACSLPFDYVKTQIQKQKPGPDGKLPYSGSLDCAAKTLKEGGPLRFYSGFATYCIRIAPHVMVSSRPEGFCRQSIFPCCLRDCLKCHRNALYVRSWLLVLAVQLV